MQKEIQSLDDLIFRDTRAWQSLGDKDSMEKRGKLESSLESKEKDKAPFIFKAIGKQIETIGAGIKRAAGFLANKRRRPG